jgi:hypothetical protein
MVTAPGAAFYCVCDSRYFLGAVAMLNSLRLVGHTEPSYVLDCGLTDSQRELLAPHATLVPAPEEAPPWLLKTVAPLRHPAEVMVLIDADMIVSRPLTPFISEARQGNVVAFENRSDRFFPEWGDILELGNARRRQYVSSSLVCLSGPLGSEIVRLMAELRDRVDFSRTLWRANDPDYPFLLADQDVLNAILATRVDPARVREVDERLEAAVPYTGLTLVDEDTLRCAYEDGTEPFAVHHFMPTKPWLEPTIPGVYSRLLSRLLRGRDVAIHIPRSELPPHLRPGLVGAAKSWRRGGLSTRFRTARSRIGARSGKPGS